MKNELFSEIVTAIGLLHNLPPREEESYHLTIKDISERVAHVWWELKPLQWRALEEELDFLLHHPQIQILGEHDHEKAIEIRKKDLAECIIAWNAINFSATLLKFFGIKWGEDLFIPRIFHPQIEPTNAVFKIRGLERNKIQKLLPWLYHEDWEKTEKIDEAITQWLVTLKERLYLLRLPVFEKLEDANMVMNITQEYKNLEKILELIRTTSVLTIRLSTITNPDVLEALDEEYIRIQRVIESIETLEPLPAIKLQELAKWIEESYGIKLQIKNPHREVDPRKWKSIAQRYLLKAAYSSHPDLIKISRLQTSIKKIRKALQEKKWLSDEQKFLVEEISEHYSQRVIRNTFDYAFYQLATRFKKSR